MGNDASQTENPDAENFCDNHDFDNLDISFDELDRRITIEEILTAVKGLQTGKAMGNDFIMNEYLIAGIDILSGHICDMFNAILDSGYFPEKWTEGVIIPLHKKGDANNVNNYRGITLVSCLSKLFTSVLNKRIVNFCETNNVISDAQFGFRKGRSTVDALFTLTNIVQNYLFNNKRLYCVYVDLCKCFDTIYRNALWMKLYKAGIQGKILRIIKDMYQKVKSCVRNGNSYTDYFEYAVGLRQGEIMSPILFSLFVEDLELFLQDNTNSGLLIDDIVLMLLLFADDMVIFGKSPQELQTNLNMLHEYCKIWGLKVNTTKTKIMVFRKRGGLLRNESWTYNGVNIDVVNDFNYLGTVFNYTGNFTLNQTYLSGKALQSLNVLLVNCTKLNLKPKLLCQLFDAFVGSILNYSSEIWGFTKSKELERIHLKFCKRILNVRVTSCSTGVYGELGRYPLYISRYIRIIKYWFKLLNTDNIILTSVYNRSVSDMNNGARNWVSQLKDMLCNYGFAYIWEDPYYVNVNTFICLFKQRIIDCFIQGWFVSKDTSGVLVLYNSCKLRFEYEPYLDIIPYNLRYLISKLRISAHSLRIHTGRYGQNRIPQNERYCLCCNTRDLEDEYHFILVCPCYIHLRSIFIKKYYFVRPNMVKFIELLQSSNRNILLKLALYYKQAVDIRTSILNII